MNFPTRAFTRIAMTALTIVWAQYLLAGQPADAERYFGQISYRPTAVHVAGQEAFAIQAAAGGFTALERTLIIEKNINNALMSTTDRSPSFVEIVYINNLPVLRFNGKHLATADTASAQVAGTTTDELCKEWAENVRRVLSNRVGVDQYIAELSGSYINSIYMPQFRRARLEAARLNRSADQFRDKVPLGLISSGTLADQGMKNLMNRDLVAAQMNFESALKLNFWNSRAHHGLGLCLLKKGEPAAAVQQFQIARQVDPDDAENHLALGQAYEALGDDKLAMIQYREAALLQPDNPEPVMYIADIREERNDMGRSVEELTVASKVMPDSEYIRLRRQDQISWRFKRPY